MTFYILNEERDREYRKRLGALLTEFLGGSFPTFTNGLYDLIGSMCTDTANAAVACMISKESLRCSFCGKYAAAVAKLIAGPNQVYICDECIELALPLLEKEKVD